MADETKIDAICIKDLHSFAIKAGEQANNNGLLPIPEIRAVSQQKNPQADPEDIALLVAYCGDRMVGYLGLLPGHLRYPDGLHKIMWFSTWYVLPEERHSLAAILLLQKAQKLGFDIFVTGVSQRAEKLYTRLGYKKLGPLEVRLITWEPLSASTAGLHHLAQKTHVPFDVLFFLCRLRKICSLPLKWSRQCLHKRAVIKFVRPLILQTLDPDQADELVITSGNGSSFVHDADFFRWMLANPWIEEAESGKDLFPDYQFSARRRFFRYKMIKISTRSAQRRVGTLLMSFSDDGLKRMVKVIAAGPQGEKDVRLLSAAALHLALQFHADEIEMPGNFDELAPPMIKLGRSEQRPYFYIAAANSPIAARVDSIHFSSCDGDTAFY